MKLYWRNLASFRFFWTALFLPTALAVVLGYFLHFPGWIVGVVFWLSFALMVLAGLGTQMYCRYCRTRISMNRQLVCKKCNRATDYGQSQGVSP